MRSLTIIAALCGSASLAAALAPSAVASPDANPEYAYHDFKDARPLTLAADSIAILDPDGLVAGADAADQRGIVAPEGWRRLATPVAARTAAGLEAHVASLLDTHDVAFASPVFLDELGGPTVIRPELFVRFGPQVGANAQAILDQVRAGSIVEPDWNGITGLHKIAADSRNGFEVLAIANTLAQRDDVIFAEPNRIITIFGDDVMPNDPGFASCWGLHNTGGSYNNQTGVVDMDVNGPQAWDHESGSSSILVAILDNGVQQNHPDLNQVTPGIDSTIFNGDGGPLFAFDNHGTPVAGCVSAIMNNNLGTVGVAPNARVLSVKIAYDIDSGSGWTSQSDWVADGVIAAAAAGCRVTNSSFGMGSSSVVTSAYDLTKAAGVMHFASTGNGGSDGIGDPTLGYPASIGSTYAIGAINPNGTLTSFSNYGLGIHFVAPGSSVWTTDRTGSAGSGSGDYIWFGGTSAASPYAAGVGALVLSADSSLSPTAAYNIMATYAKDLGPGGYDLFYGHGLPSAWNSIVETLFGDDCPGAGSCAQSNGTPGCEDANCCYTVCDEDPFCCNSSWDGLCADQAAIICFGCGNAGAGSCDEANGTPGCNDATCCQDVCAADPFCCEVSWDGVCANSASSICGPSNDTCVNAIVVTDGTWAFSNVGATTDGPAHTSCDFCCGDDQIGSDIWYAYTAPCGGQLTVSTCNTATFDTKLAVYGPGLLGGTCPSEVPLLSGILVGCNDDAPGCSGFSSSLTVDIQAGTTYKIRIGGYEGAQGSGTFSVSCSIPNEDCAFALPIFDGATNFSTIGATTDGPGEPECDFCCGDDQIGSDVWYAYDATCDGQLTVSTCDSADYDTKLAVYAPGLFGATCPSDTIITGILIGCNDDSTACGGFTSELTVDVTAGKTYKIRVGGYDEAQGNGTLNLSCLPAAPCPGDVNGDGAVDGTDLGQLLAGWGNPGTTDLNGDGTTDGLDLGILLSAWGACPG